MRWTPGNRGSIDDVRGRGGRAVPLGIGGFVVLLLLSWATGTDFLSLFTQTAPTESVGTSGTPSDPAEEQLVDFVDAVTNDAQYTWEELLGSRYQETRVVLFRDAVQSACGFAESATGPFYCPGDEKVYIDLGFYEELQSRFGAPGDFAQAYVLAHEIGHHVQNVLGTEAQVRQARGSRPDMANELSVRLELQADCYAGVWAHSTAQRQLLERGDVEEGLGAAAAVGDDRIQQMGGGRVAPEAFTHGTSEQRMRWFRQGMDSGNPESCDTFQG